MGLHLIISKKLQIAKNTHTKPRKDGYNRRRLWLRKRTISIATWNIQGLRTKQREVIREIEEMKVDVMVLTETKKKGCGEEHLQGYQHIWSGVPKSQRAKSGVSILIKNNLTKHVTSFEQVNDRIMKLEMKIYNQKTAIIGVYGVNDNASMNEKDDFFDGLNDAMESVDDQSELIIIGDLNSRVGRADTEVVGVFGEQTVNDNGKRLIDLCKEHGCVVGNTLFQHRDIHKFTWEDPTRNTKSIIDLLIMRKNRKTILKDVRVYRQPECASNHHMVIGKIGYGKIGRVNEQKSENEVQVSKEVIYKTDLLKQFSVRVLYQNRLENKLNLEKDDNCTEMYQHLKECIFQAAREALGTEDRRKRYIEKFSDDVEGLIKQKKRAYIKWLSDRRNESRGEYVQLRQMVKLRVREEKNEHWDRLCRDIDGTIGYNKSTQAWKTIKNMRKNNNRSNQLQTIPAKKWVEHYSDLLQEKRVGYTTVEEVEPLQEIKLEISEQDVKKALTKAKNNKAPGPGNLRMELLKYGGRRVVKYLTKIFNKIESGEDLPLEWNTSYITSIFKKGDRRSCTNYRGISVIPSIARLFSNILNAKIREKMPIQSEEQSGFRENRSCLDNIHCVRQLIEKTRARGIDIHMTFIDLEKAYDSIPRCRIWQAMRRLNIEEKWINIIKKMYRNNIARIKWGNALTRNITIDKGLKQGCGLSPTLFNIYLEQALENWYKKCSKMGIPIGTHVLHSLLFADDQIIFAQDREDMEYMLRKLKEEYGEWGLNINFQKTEYMCIGGPRMNIQMDSENVNYCSQFKYLGSIIDEGGTCNKDIETRITMGKQATKALHGLLWNKNIREDVKRRIFHSIVENITTYGAEMWPLTTKIRDKIRTVEMDYMRRCVQLTRRDRVRNEEVWKRMGITSSITKRLENKALQWYGHVKRMPTCRWPKRMLEWQPPRRRKPGRPALEWEAYVRVAMTDRDLETNDWEDRDLWKVKTANS